MQGSLLIIFEEIEFPKKGSASKKIHYEKKSEKNIKELEHELKSTKRKFTINY